MLQWPDKTIYQGIAAVAERNAEDTVLVFEGERATYAELLADSEALAHGLADLGVGSGDRIAVWLGNRPQWIESLLAASYLGAAVVAVNTRYRTHELEYMLTDSSCKALITEESFLDNDYLEMLAEVVPEVRESEPDDFAAEGVPSLEHVVALDDHPDFPAAREFHAVRESGRGRDDVTPAADPEAPGVVFYTSGTTSDPKGCLQSNRAILNHPYNIGEHFDLSEGDVALGVTPFCGVYGHDMFMSALTRGIPLVVQTHFDPERAIELIDAHDVTYANVLATMYERIIEAEGFAPEGVESLEHGATAFLTMSYDESLFETFEETLGYPQVQPYGLSEGLSLIFVGEQSDPPEQRKNVGGPPLHPDAEIRIADPGTDETLPPGEKGEICIRGYNVMNGYHDKPEETADVFDDDGWLHTGDLGIRDEQGYVYYHSRLDDALRVRGFLVTPRDVEGILNEHPGVELAQVVGAPHPRYGQVPVAFVKRADPSLTSETLRSDVAERVADYKVPEDVEFVDSFPRTDGPHGAKIQKGKLRDEVVDRYRDA
jgi:fatty-acyl-CoA synthase